MQNCLPESLLQFSFSTAADERASQKFSGYLSDFDKQNNPTLVEATVQCSSQKSLEEYLKEKFNNSRIVVCVISLPISQRVCQLYDPGSTGFGGRGSRALPRPCTGTASVLPGSTDHPTELTLREGRMIPLQVINSPYGSFLPHRAIILNITTFTVYLGITY